MVNTSSVLQVWNKEIDSYIEDELDVMPPSIYKQLTSYVTNKDIYNYDATISGYSPMHEVGEGGNAINNDPVEGFVTPYYLKEYRDGTTFTSTVLETDRHDRVSLQARQWARLPEYTRDINAMSVLRRGWDTTFTWGDSLQLISTAHPSKKGATQYNTFFDGVQLPLDYDNAVALEGVQGEIVSNSQNLLSVGDENRNKILVVPFALREKAFQIAGVNGPDLKPDTAENNSNYFRKGARYDVIVTKFLGWNIATQMGETAVARTSTSNYYDSTWFIVDQALAQKYFRFMNFPGYPNFTEETQIENGNIYKVAADKYKFGASGWFWIVGSKGDNSTFSS